MSQKNSGTYRIADINKEDPQTALHSLTLCLLGRAVGQQYGCRVVILMVLNYDVTQNNLYKTTKSIEANKFNV